MKQVLVILLVATLRLEATIISLGGNTVFLADFEKPVPVGSFISVGYFEPGFTDFSNLLDYSWQGLGSTFYTEVSTGLINPSPGEWAGGGNVYGIEGNQLFVWVFNTQAVPDDLGNAEFGLFSGTSSAWIAHGDGDLFHPQFNFLTVDSVDIVLHGLNSDGNLALASVPDALVSIPEPASMSFIFGFIALLFLWAQRSKRSLSDQSEIVETAGESLLTR